MDIQQQIDAEINKVVKKIKNKIVKKTEKEVAEKVSNVVNFGRQQMQDFISTSMENEFRNFYGINFSSESLKQLYSVSIVNLRPEILYTTEDINKFEANLDIQSLLDDLEEFSLDGENGDEEYYDDELYNEYYGDEDNVEDEFSYESNKKMNWNAEYYNKKFKDGQVPKVNDAFKIAKENTIKNFNQVEMPKLRAYSKKNIGIDIF